MNQDRDPIEMITAPIFLRHDVDEGPIISRAIVERGFQSVSLNRRVRIIPWSSQFSVDHQYPVVSGLVKGKGSHLTEESDRFDLSKIVAHFTVSVNLDQLQVDPDTVITEGTDPEDLTCAVCRCVMFEPRALPCDHVFCQRCVGHVGNRCPLCRADFSREDVRECGVLRERSHRLEYQCETCDRRHTIHDPCATVGAQEHACNFCGVVVEDGDDGDGGYWSPDRPNRHERRRRQRRTADDKDKLVTHLETKCRREWWYSDRGVLETCDSCQEKVFKVHRDLHAKSECKNRRELLVGCDRCHETFPRDVIGSHTLRCDRDANRQRPKRSEAVRGDPRGMTARDRLRARLEKV